jgi:tetratricopeptide (TPR) repeat protein
MGRINASNIAHLTSTDHRILRRPDIPGPLPPTVDAKEASLLALFHQDEADRDDPERGRDLGLALMDLAAVRQAEPNRQAMARQALPLLTAAVQSWPEDVPALQAQGYALWLQGRKDEALAAFEATLRKAPEREEALLYAGGVASQLGREEEALGYWRRAATVNPWSPRVHAELAGLLVKRREWQPARAECLEVLKLDPFEWQMRRLLITCLLQLGEQEAARREFGTLVLLQPQREPALRIWFGQETKKTD